MQSRRSCRHRKLVVGETCQVEECSHGTIHVALGNVTLRLSPERFLAAVTALRVAADRLERDGTAAAPVATRLLM